MAKGDLFRCYKRTPLSVKKTYTSTKGYFTLTDFVELVCDFEKLARPATKWFGGIDSHNVFFEGKCVALRCDPRGERRMQIVSDSFTT